jgi:hypothetical protein
MLRCDKKHLTAGLQLILYTNDECADKEPSNENEDRRMGIK